MWRHPQHEREAETFIRAITSSPHDDLPKMVFADWLGESGYPNAEQGMRFAAQYHKRPGDPREMAEYYNNMHRSASLPGDMDPDNTISGWLAHDPRDSSPHRDYRIPEALLWAHGSMALSHFDKTPDERVTQHWKDYLMASENAKFDENNHPMSRYPEGHPLHDTDIAFSRPNDQPRN